MRKTAAKQCSRLMAEKSFRFYGTILILVIRDSQVLAKLGVVTIFFIGLGGGGGYN